MRGTVRRLTAAALGVVVLTGVACTGGDDDATAESPASPTAASSPSPSSSPSPLPKLPVAEARLAGKYNVKVFVTANTFDSKPMQRQVFRFVPRCAEGACDASVVGVMAFGQGLEDRQSAGAEKRFNIRMVTLGRSYRGTKVDYWASCNEEPDKDRWTLAIKIDKAKYIGDAWKVVRWSGTWTRNANFASNCLPGHLRSVIRGTLDQS